MGIKNVYERFIWFDNQVRTKRHPNATSLSDQFEISTKTAQRDIEFMRDRLRCPLEYDSSQKGYYYNDETFSLPMVPASEIWLFQNKEALQSVKKGLKDASEGKISKLSRKYR